MVRAQVQLLQAIQLTELRRQGAAEAIARQTQECQSWAQISHSLRQRAHQAFQAQIQTHDATHAADNCARHAQPCPDPCAGVVGRRARAPVCQNSLAGRRESGVQAAQCRSFLLFIGDRRRRNCGLASGLACGKPRGLARRLVRRLTCGVRWLPCWLTRWLPCRFPGGLARRLTSGVRGLLRRLTRGLLCWLPRWLARWLTGGVRWK